MVWRDQKGPMGLDKLSKVQQATKDRRKNVKLKLCGLR